MRCIGWLCLSLVIVGCAPRPPGQPRYVGGIQVNEADHDAWAVAVEGAGLNTVAVTVYAMQGDWDTDHLWWDREDPAVVSEIRAARARGCGWCSSPAWRWTTPSRPTSSCGTG